MSKFKAFLLALAGAAIAGPASAHPAADHATGGLDGLVHPFLGADHMLAMLAVGCWSVLALGNRPWAGPCAFIGAMAAGAALGFGGVMLPGIESMVAASVLALGLMIMAGMRLAPSVGLGLVGLFALFHGQAHASEAGGSAAAFMAGMVVSTAAIHLAGVGLGRTVLSRRAVQLGLGLVLAGSGAAMLTGI